MKLDTGTARQPPVARRPRALTVTLMVALAVAATGGMAFAKPYWMRGAVSNGAEFLPPEEAFRLAARAEGGLLRIRWVIADGYYLYRSRIEVRAESPDLVLDPPVLPPGATLTDAYFGTQEVYRQQLDATVAYHQLDQGAHPIQIKVSYQGCAQAGLCYPLLTQVIFPEPAGSPAAQSVNPLVANPPAATVGGRAVAGSAAWETVAILGGLLAFLMAGLRLRSADRRDPS